MMNVATIGSGVIVDRMIEAMRLDGRYNLYCVYSRTQERAKEFADKHGIQKYYTDMEEMLNDENVDIVYVASPNSLHYSQSKMALEHKKHVINEKPFTPTLKECNELFEIAEKKGVYIFEAITNVHLPNYKIIDLFNEKMEPIFEKINTNMKQIQTLENLRDTLLPKLLRGEVRVEK